MYAEAYAEWIENLMRGSYLFFGIPKVAESGGPARLGIEVGWPREYYLYERVMLATPEVAGLRYYAHDADFSGLRPGRRVRLVRERANRYDRNAVEIYAPDGSKLGYVPRYAAPLVAGALDRGRRVVARVRRADAHSSKVVIQIYFMKPKGLEAV
ncbi:MAG: HIRAN domain-containing protein [bacterium]